MEESIVSFNQLGPASKKIVRRLLTIGENRLELLLVEMQEERERHLRAILLVFAITAFGLLTGITLTAAIVLSLWAYSHVATLLILAILYGAATVYLGWQLTVLLRDWQTLAASLDQLRKDCSCLVKTLS
jgi:uncharacterized membrane protein YqjE